MSVMRHRFVPFSNSTSLAVSSRSSLYLWRNITGEGAMEGHTIEEGTVFRIASFVWSLVMMMCCVVGAFGNITSLIIFTRLSMRRLSVNVLLTGLSSVDLAIVLLAIPVYAIHSLNDYLLDRKLFDTFYSIVLLALYPVSMISQTCSIWTFVLISIERYVAVCRPLIVKRLLTVRRARAAQLLLFSSAIAYNFVRFFEYRPSSDPDSGYYKPRLRYDDSYFVVFYTSLYLLTQFVIPFSVISTLNLLILRRLRQARRERERLSHAQQEQCRTTRMIIVVTLLFIVCNCLPFMVNLWEAFDRDLFKTAQVHEWTDMESNEAPMIIVQSSSLSTSIAYLLVDISNTLVVANAASTFLVYLIYCRRYRRLFWACCCCALYGKRGHSPPHTSSSYWSSFALRQCTVSISDNSAGLLVNGTEFRPRSNCVTRVDQPKRVTIAGVKKAERTMPTQRRSVPFSSGSYSLKKSLLRASNDVGAATVSEILFD